MKALAQPIPNPRHHRCGLFTCQEEGECAFPKACTVHPSALSDDDKVSETQLYEGVAAECRNCGSRSTLLEIRLCGYRTCCPERDMRRAEPPKGRIQSVAELTWRLEGTDNGWAAPPRRTWWKRLPVIRHISGLWLSWQVHTFAAGWAHAGIGVGGPNPHDLWVVEGHIHGYV